MRPRRYIVPCLAAPLLLAVVPITGVGADDPALAQTGRFSAPFSEPTVAGQATDENCVDEPQDGDGDSGLTCKPAAGSLAVLGDGEIMYFNALEDTEEVEFAIAGEFGQKSINDQSRLLDLDGPTWSTPEVADGGANPDGYDIDPLLPVNDNSEIANDGALFCSAIVQLGDGSIMAVGGTAYYDDPGMAGAPFGVAELEGIRNARIFDPVANRWHQTADMQFGRWYPSLVTLASGEVFVASGVKKLIKPIYPNQDPTDSGRNVTETETYSHDLSSGQGTWRYNGDAGDRSLPLYPRMHLLPNGHVYYNAAGQVFNPAGYAYDQASWNMAAAYDPATATWTDLGVPGVGSATPGFRGSTFSLMLPLRAGGDGAYTTAEFLTAGGILGTTPGTYVAVPSSRVETLDSTTMALSSREVGSLANPRWYSSGVLLPTGEVLALSGAMADEVVAPGSAIPVTTVELFDPVTETWRPLASANQARTYHNTAALLPDGRVLVGGHAPITAFYGSYRTVAPGVTSPNEGRDPSFEIFEPPYLFRGDRPQIRQAPSSFTPGQAFDLVLDVPASEIASVVAVRQTAITHLVDGDQRSVELEITSRRGRVVSVSTPANAAVLPPGRYMIFVNRTTDSGLVPSEAALARVLPGPVPPSPAVPATSPGLLDTDPDDLVIDPDAIPGGVVVDESAAVHDHSS